MTLADRFLFPLKQQTESSKFVHYVIIPPEEKLRVVFKAAPYINPYIAGNPVQGDFGFFGRADILRQVEQVLAAPNQNAVVLVGPRRIGKTSILLRLQESLPSDQYTVVYQDLQDKAHQPMGHLLAELAAEIADHLNIAEPDLVFDDQGRIFQNEFLSRVYEALPDKAQRVVLLFDEFDVVNPVQRENLSGNAAANQLFAMLRRWLREEPRLAFIFALGRNLNDLDSDFLATFKGGQTIKVTVFSRETTVKLITAPDSVQYTPEAVDQIYALTNGHPYFTQLLCSLCFDQTQDQLTADATQRPLITAQDVVSLLPTFFSRGDNIFAWIWDGLPPAERIVASALAELLRDDEAVATEAEIEATLQNKGVQVILRDLQVSPKKLVEWQLLQQVGEGYRFLVPVLRQWIQARKRFADVRDELDQLDPHAQRYFEIAKLEYQKDDFDTAFKNLESTLRLNPNHLQALILSGDIKLHTGDFEKAAQFFEEAYRQDARQVKTKFENVLSQWIKALLAQDKPVLAWNIYKRRLAFFPEQPDMRDKIKTGLEQQSQNLMAQGDFGGAWEALQSLSELDPQSELVVTLPPRLLDMIWRHNFYRKVSYFLIALLNSLGWTSAVWLFTIWAKVPPPNLGVTLLISGIFSVVAAFPADPDIKTEHYSLKEFVIATATTIMKAIGDTWRIGFVAAILGWLIGQGVKLVVPSNDVYNYVGLTIMGLVLLFWLFSRGIQVKRALFQPLVPPQWQSKYPGEHRHWLKQLLL
ncbi:MAG: hypothetical protein DPW09_42525 [Anaerolineae bacterium]|nr:hypothetical protein [Anaerolineae bacterium]